MQSISLALRRCVKGADWCMAGLTGRKRLQNQVVVLSQQTVQTPIKPFGT